MTKSYAKAQFRKYHNEHPYSKKMPKELQQKCNKDRGETYPIDLSLIEFEDPDIIQAERAQAIRDGDGSWAIIYDENRPGEWLLEFAENGWIDHICSECRYTINTDVHVGLGKGYEHCPRCGADMKKKHGIKFEDSAIVVN